MTLRVDVDANTEANTRRLSETEDGALADVCTNDSVTLQVFVVFSAVVDASLVDLVLKSNWTDLVNDATRNVTACGDAVFQTFPVDRADTDASNLWVVIGLPGLGALLCCCCVGLVVFVRRRRKKKKEGEPDSANRPLLNRNSNAPSSAPSDAHPWANVPMATTTIRFC